MSLMELAYQDIILISGIEYKGNRDIKTNKIDIPYTEEPDVGINDIIKVKLGKRENEYTVIDCKFMKNGTLNIGTKHPHKLTLFVKETSNQNKESSSAVINIGSIHGEQLQIGNNNTQTINITVNELVEKVAKTDDEEAKSLLRKLFENPTVASIIGAGATAIFGSI